MLSLRVLVEVGVVMVTADRLPAALTSTKRIVSLQTWPDWCEGLHSQEIKILILKNIRILLYRICCQ